jgi:DNA polymerase-1
LSGDSADNIPGVPGIGPKIAATLLQEYGSLEGLLANADEIKQKGRRQKIKENAELVRMIVIAKFFSDLFLIVDFGIIFLGKTFKAIS